MRRLALDVKELPDHGYGHTDPLWWGVIGLMAIEGTVFALLIGSYFFLRGNFEQWPPVGMPPHARLAGIVGMAFLLASAVPMYLVNQAAVRKDLKAARLQLILSTLLAIVFLVCRYLEFKYSPVRYDDDAYGSCLWAALALHTVHGITGVGENIMFITLLYKGPVERKHFTDLQVNGTYWYFVVVSWAVLFSVIYFDSGLFHR